MKNVDIERLFKLIRDQNVEFRIKYNEKLKIYCFEVVKDLNKLHVGFIITEKKLEKEEYNLFEDCDIKKTIYLAIRNDKLNLGDK